MWSVQQQQQQQHLPTYLLPIFSSASATVKDEQDGDRGAGGRGQTSKQTKYGLKGKSVGRVEYHRIE